MSPLPPPAVPPKFPDDLSKVTHQGAGPLVNGIMWPLFLIATILLTLRLYAKKKSGHGFWWDDLFVTAGWVLQFIACTLLSIMLSRGFGNHPWDYIWGTPSEILYMWVRNTFVMTAAVWCKTAFAVTLLRLTYGWSKWFVWFLLVSMNIIVAINATMNWVGCDPIQKSWIPDMPGECSFETLLPAIIQIGNVAGGYSAAVDFVLAVLPWMVLYKLQMRTKEKIGVGIAMSLGFVAGIMALIKTIHLRNLATGDSYDAAVLNIWDSVEVSVTIMAASIPALRVLIRNHASSAGGKYHVTHDNTQAEVNKTRKQQSKDSSKGSHAGKTELGTLGNDSDESILAISNVDSTNKIIRVDEITVKHADMSDGEDGINNYRMQRLGLWKSSL